MQASIDSSSKGSFTKAGEPSVQSPKGELTSAWLGTTGGRGVNAILPVTASVVLLIWFVGRGDEVGERAAYLCDLFYSTVSDMREALL